MKETILPLVLDHGDVIQHLQESRRPLVKGFLENQILLAYQSRNATLNLKYHFQNFIGMLREIEINIDKIYISFYKNMTLDIYVHLSIHIHTHIYKGNMELIE